jgi:putative thioredoxin
MAHSSYIFETTERDFESKVLEASRRVPVLVDFWAGWCAPCQVLLPILTKLAEEYQGLFLLAKVNTDVEQGLAMSFGVRSLPTLKLFKDGQIVDEVIGAQPEPVLRQMIEAHIVRESDRLCDQAQAAFEQGRAQEAVRLLRKALQIEPGHPRAMIDLAYRLSDIGEIEEAERLLEELPRELREEAQGNALRARIEFARAVRDAPELKKLVEALGRDPENLEARYQLSSRYVQGGDYEQALEQLVEILRRDRSFRDDAARKGIIAIFNMLGNSGELVSRYRREMARWIN